MLMLKLLLLFFVFAQVELFPQIAERVGQWQDELLVEGPTEKCPKMPGGLAERRKLPRETWWTSLDACLTRLNEKHWNVQMGEPGSQRNVWHNSEWPSSLHTEIVRVICAVFSITCTDFGFLQKQQTDYRIFVINQAYPQGKPTDRFNRAKLFNAGFLEVIKINREENNRDFDCFIFHDIDVVPESELNLYRCNFDYPTRFIQSRECEDYGIFPWESFAAVVGLTGEQYGRLNGFSNHFWGWGYEDHEMSIRIRKGSNYKKFVVTDEKDATYMSLDADQKPDDKTNPPIMKECTDRLLDTAVERMPHDGVNNVKYKVVQIAAHKLYTNISVDLMYWESINATDFPCHDLVHKWDQTNEGFMVDYGFMYFFVLFHLLILLLLPIFL